MPECDTTCDDSLLSEAQQERLAQILDDYLNRMERGEAVGPEQLLAQHPEEASQLRGYLSGLALFHRAAAHCSDATLVNSPQLAAPLHGTLGGYELGRVIGRGGMGVVYEATERSLNRRVALKALPLTASGDQTQLNRFKNEARAAANIEHPHIVPVYAIGEENGLHYYTMQLIEGPSLAVVLERFKTNTVRCNVGTTAADKTQPFSGTLPGESVGEAEGFNDIPEVPGLEPGSSLKKRIQCIARLGMQAAEALHAAHEHGIVHRDIKPSNLLVANDGKLWVTDFGLARCRDQQSETRTGDILGTMRYMSPEQARGKGELVDHRTDIYSLGLTLYELISLHHPAGDATDAQIMFDRDKLRLRPLRHWDRHIPHDLQTIIHKAMAELPEDRYRTAADLAADLGRFLAGESIHATPPTLLNRCSKWTRRHRKLVTAAAVIVGVAFFAQSFNNLLLARKNSEVREALASSEHNLGQALDILDRLGTQTVDQLAAVPGAEGVYFDLLQDNLEYYEHFEDEAANHPLLEEGLARAYDRMGVICYKLGRTDEAIQRHLAARDLWQQRLTQQAATWQYRQGLVRSCNHLAVLYTHLGNYDEADKNLSLAEQVFRDSTTDVATHSEQAIELAATLNNRGLLDRAQGDLATAGECFRQAIATLTPHVDEQLTDLDALQIVAASYNNLASLNGVVDNNEAIASYHKAIEIQLRMVESNRANRLYQGNLARTYSNLGSLEARTQNWNQAEVCFHDAIALQEHLVQASPLSVSYQRDLAISYNNLGMAQYHAANYDDAHSAFKQAYTIQHRLLEAFPEDAKLLSDLAGVCNNLGLLFGQQEKHEQAEAAFKQAITNQLAAHVQAPGLALYRDRLGNHYISYATYLQNQNQPEAAQRLLDDRHRLLTSADNNATGHRQ